MRRKMSPRAPQSRWLKLLHSPVGDLNLLGGHGIGSRIKLQFLSELGRSKINAFLARPFKSEEIVSCVTAIWTRHKLQVMK